MFIFKITNNLEKSENFQYPLKGNNWFAQGSPLRRWVNLQS